MKFGYFDDENKEYVISSPRPPLPWINYLGSLNFFSIISNTSGGYSFYKDAKLLRLTRYRYNNIPLDSNGHYYYIKDGNTIWNPGWQPSQTELDYYVCRHGIGYSIFEGKKNGLHARQEVFVPVDDPCEVTRLTISNNTSDTKELELFSFVEFCLWNAMDDATNFQRNYSIGEVEVDGSSIYHITEYRERRNHYAVYSVNVPIDGFDTSRDSFCGIYGSLSSPEAVVSGKSHNSITHGWAPIGSHQIHVVLSPGQSQSFIFVLGYCENPAERKFSPDGRCNKEPAERLLSRYKSNEQFNSAFLNLRQYWDKLLSKFTIESDDMRLNRMFNIWNQYQCMVTFNMSRSASYFESGLGRGMGFRDSCQDLLGFVHLIPERARERILDIASTQLQDGSTYHQYQPLTKRGNADIGSGFNDDPLWLIACTSAYIKETGDFSILNELCPFNNDKSTAATLMEHLRRSLNYTISHKGPHGLPLIGRADWNDCLNLNCFSTEPGESFQTTGPSEGPVAESIFIAGMFVKYGREYADICSHIGLVNEASAILREVEIMYRSILKSGWDGEWFLRAYDSKSQPIGSHTCKEGQIYIEPQGMCIMAGVGIKEGYAQKALDNVEKRLDTPYGIMLHQPAYTQYNPGIGEISSYPPGYKENAGIFCHTNPWIICAETILSHGNRAFELYKKICPAYIEDISEIHRTEPYVFCQMVAGRDATTFGEGKNSWLTGTAAWAFTAISQYILGIRPVLNGLMIDPCIPSSMKGFSCTRIFRGAVYHITVDNTAGVEKGISEIRVDGKVIPGNVIPAHNSKSCYEVNVIMG